MQINFRSMSHSLLSIMHDLMPGKLWDQQKLRNSTQLLPEIIKKLELPLSRRETWATTILSVKVPCKRSNQILKCLHFSKNKNNEECRLCKVRLMFHHLSTLFKSVLAWTILRSLYDMGLQIHLVCRTTSGCVT
jgi:hypothetical protein